MNVALWIMQVIVAMVFLFSAVTKGTWSKEKLVAKGQTGVGPVPLAAVRFVALAELLGVLGLLLPWAMDVAPVLTPLAAIGLAIIMVGAALIHLRLGEPRTVLGNAAILILCVVVASGRLAHLG
ncbi:DoxX family protein [Rugosimonospora africana]|uniref:DoxX-like protein n=1 Tax=Rugosimonospora africana TaxID=556532 RepID=A0A8J3QZ20_9ACTN|nr:DoxX family protein [Rugosimonospora africana]GIH19518.1 hypothetical protein Raf01_76900 [Rugosimonospora africana]